MHLPIARKFICSDFQQGQGAVAYYLRPMPSSSRLITIPFSHYCEKARWAGDHLHAPYVEEPHIPGGHLRAVNKVGGKTVPVLVTEAETFTDSTEILHHFDRAVPPEKRLFPVDPGEYADVAAFEESFDADLGPATRLLVYHHGLSDQGMLVRVVSPSLTRLQRVAFRALLVPLAPQLRKFYRIDDHTAAKAVTTVRGIFERVGAALADGREFLVGSRFTAADLTFAALAAPVLMPPKHPSFGSNLDDAPGALRELMTSLRATPAGAYVLRMYREHR